MCASQVGRVGSGPGIKCMAWLVSRMRHRRPLRLLQRSLQDPCSRMPRRRHLRQRQPMPHHLRRPHMSPLSAHKASGEGTRRLTSLHVQCRSHRLCAVHVSFVLSGRRMTLINTLDLEVVMLCSWRASQGMVEPIWRLNNRCLEHPHRSCRRLGSPPSSAASAGPRRDEAIQCTSVSRLCTRAAALVNSRVRQG